MELNDWLDIILAYLKVLVWPLAVITLAVLYKRSIVGVLERLRKASGWGATLELEHEARQLANASAQLADESAQLADDAAQLADESDGTSTKAEAETPAAPEPTAHQPVETPAPPATDAQRNAKIHLNHNADLSDVETRSFRRQLSRNITERSPRWSIVAAWDRLEKVALTLGTLLNIDPIRAADIPHLAAYLADRKMITVDTAALAFRLNDLRSRLRFGSEMADLSPGAFQDFLAAVNNLTDILEGVTSQVMLIQADVDIDEPAMTNGPATGTPSQHQRSPKQKG